MMQFSLPATAIILAAAALAAEPAEAQVTKFSPAATNSIVLIDVAGLHNSPIGKERDWAAKHVEDYAAGRVPFPPTAQTIMFAREVDPAGLHAVRREAAVMKLSEAIGFQRLAEVVGGKVQKIGGRSVVASPRGFLAALVDETSVAGYFPADRPAFARFLKNGADAEKESLSPYLSRVAAMWPRMGQVMIALDLAEGVDEAMIAEELMRQKDAVKNEDEARALAKVFSHIEGMRFSIAATDKVNAEWTIDFSEPATGSEQALRPYFENAVKRLGDSALDLSKWEMTSTPKLVTFRSMLTPEQFRGVMEGVHSPILMGQSLSRMSPPDATMAKSSQQYFRSVNNIVSALDRFADNLNDYNAAAYEYDRSAARIQRLSTANVDPEVVRFGETIASMLFSISSSLRGVPREAAVQTASHWDQRFFRGPSYYNPGWNYPWRWGIQPPVFVGGDNRSPVDEARGNIARAAADEATMRRNDWIKIRELQRATDAKMTNKYGVDFTPKK
jgi:hypothetical protein